VWIIRDGAHRQSTGCGERDLEGAQQALSKYISDKYQPPTGLGPRLLIDEVMAAYLKGRANTSPSREKAPARKDYWLSRDEVARRLRLARKHGQTNISPRCY
jgi:hypothetical protein